LACRVLTTPLSTMLKLALLIGIYGIFLLIQYLLETVIF
jgi:hypothetical protein